MNTKSILGLGLTPLAAGVLSFLTPTASAQCCCGGGPPPPPPPQPAGGTWTGPGDSVPTPGTGYSPNPSVPGQAPGQPGTGGNNPSNGNAPRPSSGIPTAAGPGASSPGVAAATTPNTSVALPETSWQYWWLYNRAPFWDLKNTIANGAANTGSRDFFLGHGTRTWESDERPLADRARTELAPTLRAVLEDGRASDPILAGAMLALAKFGEFEDQETPTVELLLGYLDHPQMQVAETAVLALGILGVESAALPLARLVENEAPGQELCMKSRVPERMRAYAAYSLGQLAERTERVDVRRFAAQKLTATFDRDRKASYDLQVACVLSVGLAAVEEGPERPVVQRRSRGKQSAELPTRALESQVVWALGVARDDDRANVVRGHGPTTAARLVADRPDGDALKSRVIEELVELVNPRTKVPREVTQSALLALAELADADRDELDAKARRAVFGSFAKESDQLARAFALIALAKIGGRPGNGEEPIAAADEIRKHLARELSRGKSFARPWAAIAIGLQERALDEAGALGSADQRAALRAALEDARSPELAGALCTALGIARDRQAAEALSEVLERSSPEVREYAMVALGMIEDAESAEALEEVLADSKNRPGLLAGAAIGLTLLKDQLVVPRLLELLEDDPSLSVVGSTCFSLSFVGDGRAIDGLMTLAFDESQPALARGIALEALGNAADKEMLPWNTALRSGTNYRSAVATLTSPDSSGVLDD